MSQSVTWNRDYANFTEALGAIFDIASCSKWHRRITLFNMRLWVYRALELGQYLILIDSAGQAAAYVTWAFPSQKTIDSLAVDEIKFLSIHQWAEGGDLWLMDFGFGDRSASKTALQIRHELRKFGCSVSYAREKRKRCGGKITLVKRWKAPKRYG